MNPNINPNTNPNINPNMNKGFNDPSRELTEKDNRSGLMVILLAVSVFLLWEMGIFGGMNFGFTLAYFAVFAVSTVYLLPARKGDAFTWLCGILSLCFSAVFTVNSSGFVKFFSFVALVILFLFYVGGISDALLFDTATFRSSINLFYLPFFLTFMGVPGVFRLIFAKPKRDSGEDKGSGISFSQIILGLLIALPVLCIMIPLLSDSDAAFSALAGRMFKNAGEYVGALILTAIFAPFLMGMVYKLKKHDHSEQKKYSVSGRGHISVSLLAGFLGALSVIYLMYLFSQLAYISGGFLGLLPKDYSFADYARQGFFQMCAATVINLIIIAICVMLCRKKANNDIPLAVKLFAGFFCIFDLFLVASAMAKMVMYISEYGLTQKRVYVTLFMMMLGVVFICIGLRMIFRRFRYVAVIILFCSLIGLVSSLANVDRVIAEYNIEAYETGKLESLDLYALGKLSDGAIPAIYEFYTTTDNEELREQAEDILRSRVSRTGSFENELREYNYSVSRAKESLEKFGK